MILWESCLNFAYEVIYVIVSAMCKHNSPSVCACEHENYNIHCPEIEQLTTISVDLYLVGMIIN